MQVEDGNLRAAVDAHKRTYHADASVGILDHAANLIISVWISVPKRGQQQRAKQRYNNLATMCMPGELERKSAGRSALVGEVRLVRQQYRDAIGWQPSEQQIEPVASNDNVVYTCDMQF